MSRSSEGCGAIPRVGVVSSEDLSGEWQELLRAALKAREHAHAPYSHFQVGAAVRGGSGRVYTGCNVENASFGLTVCAERVAIWKAISEGESALKALVVATSTGATPCGACRQVMAEFGADVPILVADIQGLAWPTSLQALLPKAFPYIGLHNDESLSQHKGATPASG